MVTTPSIFRVQHLMLALALLFSSTADAQYFWMRCAAWSGTVFNHTDKLLYISGLRDGLIFADLSIQGVLLPSVSSETLVRAVDELCGASENMRIPVPFILKAVAMRVDGQDADSVEVELQGMRRRFSEN